MASTTPQPSEVGWQFVPQYYQFVNKEPERLHCFYGKSSTFVHGTEGEEAQTCHGQQEIHAEITKIGFQDCKIFIHSVDAQSSANGGIVIQVIGEMSNKNESVWRKFVQTFFLAEQPNGYFVLNDIFRFLKEDTVDDDVPEEEAVPDTTVPSAPSPAPEPVAVAPAPAPAVPEFQEPPPPAVVDTTAVPVEEPPTTVSDIADVPVQTTPAPEPTPVPQPNGIHHEAEKQPSPSPVPKSPAPPPAAAAAATATPPPPAQQPAAPSTAPPPATAAAPATPAPQAAPQPVQPAAPPQPKTWANLAATNPKGWGSAVAQGSRGTTENVPSTPASGSGTHTPQNATAPAQRGASPHPAYAAAQSVTTSQCFIKSVNEAVTEPALKAALSRFGPVKSVEIVRNKACAFAEFQTVDAAKRAIISSLPVNAGGEGGLKVDAESGPQRVVVETKRERGDRPAPRGRGGPPFNEGRGGAGGDRGSGFRGSARGGARGRGGGAGK